MNPGHALTLLLMAAICLVAAAGPKFSCSSSNENTFSFTVRSQRNETRHRIVTADVQSDLVPDNMSNANASNAGVELSVVHSRTHCVGLERIVLSSRAVATELIQSPFVEGYEFFPGLGQYKLHTNAATWEVARSICVKEGGHLIVINSDAEAEVVKQFFARKPTFQGTADSDYIFVGIHDYIKEGKYMAVTGEELNKTGYSRWVSSQPDGSAQENYVVADKNGHYRDINNNYSFGFICEK